MQQVQRRLKLTDHLISSTLPQDKFFVLIDTEVPGLQCFINPKGKKSFKLRIRGLQKAIGQFPIIKCADARKTALIWRGELLKGSGLVHKAEKAEVRDINVDQIIEEYLQYKQSGKDALGERTFYQYSFAWKKYISPALGDKMLSKLTDVDINTFFVSIKSTYSFIQICTAILKPVFSYADSMGYPISHLRPEKWIKVKGGKKERYFTSGELSKLKNILSEHYDATHPHSRHMTILELLIYTGCRCGEILKMRWNDIFLEEGYIQLWKTKTKKGRIIPIIPEIETLIKRIPRTVESYVFFSPLKKDRPMTYAALETYWLSLMKKGNFNDDDIERLTIHSLRHTYITAANRIGISPWTIAALVGHTVGNSMTGLYIHHNLNELKIAQTKIITALETASY